MRPSIVLFGDSITEEAFGEGGWAACLANHYSRSADVVLRGYNTRWAARVAARAVATIPAGQVAAVTVCFGANDAALPDRACALQHVPVAEYRDNLRAILTLLEVRGRDSLRFGRAAAADAFFAGT
jgi:isoamyl acetate esterase